MPVVILIEFIYCLGQLVPENLMYFSVMDKELFIGNYVVPCVEIIEVSLELGFASSNVGNGIDGMPEHEF